MGARLLATAQMLVRDAKTPPPLREQKRSAPKIRRRLELIVLEETRSKGAFALRVVLRRLVRKFVELTPLLREILSEVKRYLTRRPLKKFVAEIRMRELLPITLLQLLAMLLVVPFEG